MKYRVLADRLAVCRLAAGSAVPPIATAGEFLCIVRTADELSVVCPEDRVNALGDQARVELGWVALKLEGPFPFAMTGVLASFLEPLAAAEIPIFAVSTFDTDYVLVKSGDLDRGVKALAGSGHKRL